MRVHTICRRWTARPIAWVEAPSLGAAAEVAVGRGTSLLYADLRCACLAGLMLAGADLRGVDGSGVDARGADLSRADARSARLACCRLEGVSLRGADLRGADLRGSDLRRADLRDARLTGADLRGAIFQGARLGGTRIDWRWGALPLEILRQSPGAGDEGSRAVAELAFAEDDERPFGWLRLLMLRGLATDQVLAAFAGHVCPVDNAPALLRSLAADASPAVVDPPAIWTVCRPAARRDVRQPA